MNESGSVRITGIGFINWASPRSTYKETALYFRAENNKATLIGLTKEVLKLLHTYIYIYIYI